MIQKKQITENSEGKYMKKAFSKRGKIRLASYVIAAIAALAIWGSIMTVKSNRLERQATASLQRALNELGSYLDNIETDLAKGIYANTPPMIAGLSSNIWRETAAAKSSLSALPSEQTELINTYKFLSQVGEFTMALNTKASNGTGINAEELAQLERLSEYAGKLSDKIDVLRTQSEEGMLSFNRSTEMFISDAQEDDLSHFGTEMTDTEQALTDYPTLIYDGPFSDHINQKEPQSLKGKNNISEDEAAAIAAEFTGTQQSLLRRAAPEEGNLPAYVFYTDEFTISVSKQGGAVCYMLGFAYAGEATINQSDAIARAAKYLEAHGYTGMKESYFSTTDGICTINFAYVLEDGTVCYPDLIKVTVGLDTGKILSFDARGYIMNHHERAVPEAQMTYLDAALALSPNLTVTDFKSTIIPTDFGSEIYCYEFLCTGKNNDELLVYINPETGYEEEILLLLYADGGILTK